MDTSPILPIIGLVLFFGIIFFSLYKIYTNKKLKDREKSNLMFLIIYLPILGSLYYFFWRKKTELQ